MESHGESQKLSRNTVDQVRLLTELKVVQLPPDTADQEKWPVLYLCTDTRMAANALWGCLDQWKMVGSTEGNPPRLLKCDKTLLPRLRSEL